MLLFALMMLLFGGALSKAGANPMFAGGMGLVLALIYVLVAALYIYPGMKLWKYANYIESLKRSGDTFDLEMALSQQRSFWKFMGMIFLVIVSLYALVFIGAIVLGGFASMSGR